MARDQYIRWLISTRDLSPHTIRAYDGDISTFERHLGRQAVVAQIGQECLIAFIEQQRAAGLAPTSIRRRASGVRGFCGWLLSRHLLESDPWAGVTVPVGRVRKLPRLLNAHQLNLLLVSLQDAAGVDSSSGAHDVLEQPHDSTTLLVVALMIATGVRVNEMVGVSLHDIDLAGRCLRITGKGRRERLVYLTNDWLTGLMRSYLRARQALGVAHHQLLFNQCGGPLTAPAIRSRLAKAATDAGLGTRVTPHMLRHTAATQLIEAGVDIRLIQRLLGHASLTTTEIYTHVSDRALRASISNVDVVGRFLWCRTNT